MRKWNEHLDAMDPGKKSSKDKPIDVSRSATVRYFSVYPRNHENGGERVGPSSLPSEVPRTSTSRHHNAELSVPIERYISRSSEFRPNNQVPQRSDAGHVNYAWVD